MRTREVCALTLEDIDFENRIIKIKHNIYDKTKDNKDRWYLEITKTETGTREVYISETLLKALKNYKFKQDYFKKVFGKDYIYYYLEDVKMNMEK